jgi:signal peptide peptidase SppA
MPKPSNGETKKDYLSRCVSQLIEKEGKEPDQARAQCESMWNQDKKKGESVTNKIPLIMDSVINTPWAILPSKLDEIMVVLKSKNDGILLEMAEQNKQVETQDRNYSVEDGIAEIIIDGTLSKRMGMTQAMSGGTSYSNIQSQIKRAEDDPNVKGIFYSISSPGGNVDGMFNTSDAISNAKKPSLAFADGLMASAAYIMGSGADYVVASDRSAEIGSLGVVAIHLDKSKMLEKGGIVPTVFSAGKYKALGNPYEKLKDKDAEHLQSKLDYMYSLAIDTVSRHRNVPTKELINLGADVFIGEQAIMAGFVDEILTKNQAMNRLKEMI